MGSTSMAAEQVVSAYATALFVRSEAEIKRPVVLLSGERTNIYGVLEKHMRETALPPSERFWRAVRTQWTPQLDTWRPRVNGVQLKVGRSAYLAHSTTPRPAWCGVPHPLAALLGPHTAPRLPCCFLMLAPYSSSLAPALP
jgi:hypothetical protein